MKILNVVLGFSYPILKGNRVKKKLPFLPFQCAFWILFGLWCKVVSGKDGIKPMLTKWRNPSPLNQKRQCHTETGSSHGQYSELLMYRETGLMPKMFPIATACYKICISLRQKS